MGQNLGAMGQNLGAMS